MARGANAYDQTSAQEASGESRKTSGTSLMLFHSQAILLSQRFVHLYWATETEACAEFLNPTVMLLDATGQSRIVGKTAVAGFLQAQRAAFSAKYAGRDEQYDVNPISNDSCCVTASFLTSDPNALGNARGDETYQGKVMCNLVWAVDPHGLPSLRMLVHSQRAQDAGDGEGQETALARDAREATARPRRLSLQAHDTAGTTHWVLPENVIYVAAAHQYTNVYCRDRLIHLRASFSQVLDQLGDVVVRIHRSYAVNPSYISYMDGDELHLSNGAKIPVPVKRVREVRQMLAERAEQLGERK